MITIDGQLHHRRRAWMDMKVQKESHLVDMTQEWLEKRDGRAVDVAAKTVLGLAALYFLAQVIRMWWA